MEWITRKLTTRKLTLYFLIFLAKRVRIVQQNIMWWIISGMYLYFRFGNCLKKLPSVLLRIPNTQLIWDQTWQWKNIYQNSAAKAQQNYAIKTWKPEISVFFYRTFASSWWHIEKNCTSSPGIYWIHHTHPSMFAT